jgi:hemerythrin
MYLPPQEPRGRGREQMSFLVWNSRMATGVAELDEQHKKLIGIINVLHDAMKEKRGQEAIGRTFDELLEYIRVHFATEENLMLQCAYPDYPLHKAEHDRLTAIVLNYKKDIESGRKIFSTDVMVFLHDWLMKHTTGMDRDYGPHLNRHGIR